MCTVTWSLAGDGYTLLFNRDELRSRRPALPPVLGGSIGERRLMPVDPVAGGSWISVNEHGVAIALLNLAGRSVAGTRQVSRGLVVAALAGLSDPAAILLRLSEILSAAHPPFLLVLVKPGDVRVATWDGQSLATAREEGLAMQTTTSFAPDDVVPFRKDLWLRCLKESGENIRGAQERFHAHHDPGKPAHSIRMRREDARTLSRSTITVGPDSILFRYAELDELGSEVSVHLATMIRTRVKGADAHP